MNVSPRNIAATGALILSAVALVVVLLTIPKQPSTPRAVGRPADGTPGLYPTSTLAPGQRLVTVAHYSGTENAQTPAFAVADGAVVSWTVEPLSVVPGTFTLTDGTTTPNVFAYDTIANLDNITAAHSGQFVLHDGSIDLYLTVEAQNVRWTATVQQEE